MSVQDIQAQDLRAMLKNNRNKVEVIDVREDYEYEEMHIKGSKLIPMGELMQRMDEIDWTKEVVFICRSGARSKMMANMMSAGGKELKNLQYGIFECQEDGKGEFLEMAGE
jgi:rhodanese-related sulfurtransferase